MGRQEKEKERMREERRRRALNFLHPFCEMPFLFSSFSSSESVLVIVIAEKSIFSLRLLYDPFSYIKKEKEGR